MHNTSSKSKLLLYMKPDWDSAGQAFPKQWRQFLGQQERLWNDRVQGKHVFEDQSLALMAEDLSPLLALAEELKRALKKNTAAEFIPVYFVIEKGTYAADDSNVPEALNVSWQELETGEVFLSPDIRKIVISHPDLKKTRYIHPMNRAGYFKVTGQQKNKRNALGQSIKSFTSGHHPPCFYCGSKNHPVTQCPSKKMVISIPAKERLGYLSFERIDDAMKSFVADTAGINRPAATQGNQQSDVSHAVWAKESFFGVKRVFQLSFFRQIWDAKVDNWDHVLKLKPKKEEKGGLVWMGVDCIRVSKLSQAETFLMQATEKYGEDYRAFCALGFLYVEKNDFLMARQFFMKALDRTETTPQKLFVNLLMCRLYDIENYPSEAADKVKDILHLDKKCLEACYQDVILKFKAGNTSDAVGRLKKLVEKDRQFFLSALIDPDLAPYSKEIYPRLEGMVNRVRAISLDTIGEAKIAYEKSKALLGEKEMEEADAIWARMQKVKKFNGYFAYLDLIDDSKKLIKVSARSIQRQKKELFEKLQTLKSHVDRCLRFVRAYRFQGLTQGVKKGLMALDKGITDSKNMANSDKPERFVKSFDRPVKLNEDLSRVESKLKVLDMIQVTSLFFTVFGKAWVIIQSLIAVVAIVLFPVAAYYLNMMLPKRGMPPIDNVGGYQQGILIVGGLIAIGVAVYRATKAVKRGKRLVKKEKVSSDDPCFSI